MSREKGWGSNEGGSTIARLLETLTELQHADGGSVSAMFDSHMYLE